MSRCIEVRGYLALFDIKESDKIYSVNRKIATQIMNANIKKTIPIVISHLDFRVDLTIGYIIDLKIDNKGLYCSGLINNEAFLEAHDIIQDDFLGYFSTVNPSPFLYLKACLPSFSLSHDKNTFSIKHVALVDVGARRGSLVSYRFINQKPIVSDSARCTDFLVVLGLYTRNTIKLARTRNDCLYTDALLCGETDTAFIHAGMQAIEKNINRCEQQLTLKQQSDKMANTSMDDALEMIGTIATVLAKRKRPADTEEDDRPVKKQKQQPIIHASQTFANHEENSTPVTRTDDEMIKFRDEMKQMQKEFFVGQSNMMKELFSQTLLLNKANSQPLVNTREPSKSKENTSSEPNHDQDRTQIDVPKIISDSSNIAESGKVSECKTAESNLIEAGMQIDKSEYLLNELFSLFLKETFGVKKNYTK